MGCPKCGCNDGTKVGEGSRFGRTFRRIRCRHCSKIYRHNMEAESDAQSTNQAQKTTDAVDYFILQCPFCKSEKHSVYKTDKPVRYHKCKNCEKSFKSVERRLTSR
jgi:hypothetical protein